MAGGMLMIEKIRQRLVLLHEVAPDSLGDLLRLELVAYDEATKEYILKAKTESWMRNVQGTLHGGMCATIADQAMGSIAYCFKPGEGISPTIDLHVSYHRPLIPGDGVLARVRVVATTKTLIHMACELYRESAPEKLCISSSATYYFKPAQER
jgi:uncharacterized protein (TIGR00369 family)